MEVFSVSRLLPLPTYWNSPLRLIDYDAVDSNLDFFGPEFAAMYLQLAVPRKDETTEAISHQPESPAGSMRSRKLQMPQDEYSDNLPKDSMVHGKLPIPLPSFGEESHINTPISNQEPHNNLPSDQSLPTSIDTLRRERCPSDDQNDKPLAYKLNEKSSLLTMFRCYRIQWPLACMPRV
ncbi:hypothetical protein BOTCAL_1403g00020 [Botryotinia calthae]|uniref:Uncharacterized protein n=1 Tax=Botryotinia calthae TaxID=38488 RepID=A0A4Y8CEP2_9HELO|nr:hypothetical protein BOTCAL_1403g00020 [Botryotinia calthae]